MFTVYHTDQQSPSRLQLAYMAESVDFYLDWCAERNKEPEKPFSGKLMVRTNCHLAGLGVRAYFQ